MSYIALELKKFAHTAAKVPALLTAYFEEDDRFSECYSFRPDMSGLKKAAKERTFPESDRSVLHTVLSEQAKASSYVSKASLDNIQALKDSSTRTIVTGHQLCLYGGPMFFPYKILSAIKLSQQLSDKGVKAVPVYWMASEDHDFDEINHVFLGTQKISWEREQGGAVGEMTLEGLDAFQSTLEKALGNSPLKKETLSELKKIYAPERTLSEATRDFVYWLFGYIGIVVIDAADPRLKELFIPYMKMELGNHFSFEAVSKQSKLLQAHDWPAQVTPREINLFYMIPGVRERIVKDGEGWATVDGSHQWTAEALGKEVDEYPERFSPNVILRPIYQEVILPNIAYIGGPGELSYWLQLKSAFDKVEAAFPVLVLRDMAVILDEKAGKRMSQLGLGIEHVYADQEDLFTELVRKEGSHEEIVTGRLGQFDKAWNDMINDLQGFDPTLAEHARAEQKRHTNRLENVRKKILREDRRKQSDTERRLTELLGHTYPNQTPQERVHSWLMYTSFGEHEKTFGDIIEAFDPLERSLKMYQH